VSYQINMLKLKNNPVRSSFMTYYQICNKSNTTDATCWAGTDYTSGAP